MAVKNESVNLFNKPSMNNTRPYIVNAKSTFQSFFDKMYLINLISDVMLILLVYLESSYH